MRILVMVKQVCEPESLFDLREGRVVLRRPLRQKMNSYDEYALEEALRLAEQCGGQVTPLTVGPAGDKAVLIRAAGMGAARGVHISYEGQTPLRPSNIAAMAAAWAQEQAYDLILAGVMSEDALQGAVGPMLAELLGLPLTTAVVELALEPESGLVRVVREMEGGRRQRVSLPLPALLTVQSSPHRPRYPSLSSLLQAKKNPPQTIPASGLPAGRATEQLLGVYPLGQTRAGLVLQGSSEQKAAALLSILRERALL